MLQALAHNGVPVYCVDTVVPAMPAIGVPVLNIVTFGNEHNAAIVAVLQSLFQLQHIPQPPLATEAFADASFLFGAALLSDRASLLEYALLQPTPFHISVSSVLQRVYSAMHRELAPDGTLPDSAQREFFRVGALLEMADIEFRKLRTSLSESRQSTTAQELDSLLAAIPTAPLPEQVANNVPADQPVHDVSLPGTPMALSIESIETFNLNASGPVEIAAPMAATPAAEPADPLPVINESDEITPELLKAWVATNDLVAEIDGMIAQRVEATMNTEVDVEGDVERLRFLRVLTFGQLIDRLRDNKNEVAEYAERWIGKDIGGSFDKGISLFYLEYLLVGKKNDPALAIEYVLKFISDNDYSARFIIPTYNAVRKRLEPSAGFSHLTLK